jgi:hypothetical protein
MEQVVDNKLEQYLHVWKCWEQIKKLCIGNRPCKEYWHVKHELAFQNIQWHGTLMLDWTIGFGLNVKSNLT